MTVNVLVVDDSLFFRHRLKEILNADNQIEVIATVSNGADAVAAIERLQPDVVTMDVEMPVMDGITAVREIMRRHPVPILMFSSLTTDGAHATLEALDAGALDFLPKKIDEISGDKASAKQQLCERVRLLAEHKNQLRRAPKGIGLGPDAARRRVEPPHVFNLNSYQALVVGASTGGPAALQVLLRDLPADFPLPVLLVQHMPESFTQPFARRLDKLCRIEVRQAEDGDRLRSGTALLAPGGRQMIVERSNEHYTVRILSRSSRSAYSPSVDVTFGSAANAFPGPVMAIVLTGMGHDGRDGARLLKQHGATVWVQDDASSVVSGMPMSVADAGLADAVLPLEGMSRLLARGG